MKAVVAGSVLALALCANPARAVEAKSCPTKGTAVYFGNGVNNSYDEAMWVSLDDLPGLAEEARITDVSHYGVAYNHTDGLLSDVIETLEQKTIEDSRFSWFLLNNLAGYTLRGLSASHLVGFLAGQEAFIKQLQDLVNLGIAQSSHQTSTFYDSDVADQVIAYLDDMRTNADRVIVVAHSQGNLYAHASRARLAAESAVLWFGIASVATPAEVATNGYVTSQNDAVIGLLRTLGRTVLPANVTVPISIADFMGHGFKEIYINAALPARAPVVTMLASIGTSLPYPPTPDPGDCSSDPPRPPLVTGGSGGTGMVSGTAAPGQTISYQLELNAGQIVMLRVADVVANPFVPAISVRDSSGSSISTTWGADVASTTFTAATSGTFLVSIYDGSGNLPAAGEFNLYFAVVPGANEGGALSPGGTAADSIAKGDLDSYTFSAAAGQGVMLRAARVEAGSLSPAIAVYDPSGTAIGSNWNDDVAGLAFVAGATGSYTLIVSDITANLAGTGAYAVHFTLSPGANEGGALSPGGTVSGTIDKGDLDSYSLNASSGDRIVLRLTSVAGNVLRPALNIYGPSGAPVTAVWNDSEVEANWIASASGTYTVVVHDLSASLAGAGPYTLSFALTPAP
jgi:hypothetical protein